MMLPTSLVLFDGDREFIKVFIVLAPRSCKGRIQKGKAMHEKGLLEKNYTKVLAADLA